MKKLMDKSDDTYSLQHVELPNIYMELPEVWGSYGAFMMEVGAYLYHKELISGDLLEKMFGVWDDDVGELIQEEEFSSQLTNDILEGLIVKYGYIIKVGYDAESDDATHIYKLEFKS